jgi:protein-S-isoprenylcysteine O-methyltransferase Ste14
MAPWRLVGVEALRARFPELLNRRAVLTVAGELLAVVALVTAFFLVVDRVIPEWMPDGEILVLAAGFVTLAGFFRPRLAAQTREQGYRQAFLRRAIPGLGIVASAIAHLAYMPGPPLPSIWWRPWLQALGWIYLAIGCALWLRAFAVLGVDNLVGLYVYWPEESRLIDSRLYQVMRHPIYGVLLRIGAGLALVHANWFALVSALVLWIFLIGWITLVEEKELLRRVPAYAEYRRRVPAFGPRPRDIGVFWRLLIRGD